MTPEQRVQRILDEAVGSDLTSFEKFEFLPSINGHGSWDLNPWVWVIEFKQL